MDSLSWLMNKAIMSYVNIFGVCMIISLWLSRKVVPEGNVNLFSAFMCYILGILNLFNLMKDIKISATRTTISLDLLITIVFVVTAIIYTQKGVYKNK